MRLSELIRHLLDVAGSTDTDPDVRIATQPTWPLAHSIRYVTHVAADDDAPGVVWLAEGGRYLDTPYAPREAWGE